MGEKQNDCSTKDLAHIRERRKKFKLRENLYNMVVIAFSRLFFISPFFDLQFVSNTPLPSFLVLEGKDWKLSNAVSHL